MFWNVGVTSDLPSSSFSKLVTVLYLSLTSFFKISKDTAPYVLSCASSFAFTLFLVLYTLPFFVISLVSLRSYIWYNGLPSASTCPL